MCQDMNDFYLGLVAEEERRRVESLEPFDEHEVSWTLVVISFIKSSFRVIRMRRII